ncbi:rhodanese-like domain-containing protein [Conexibacter stalactiti]|uniref:Rhodanese-like domain-containing protein n=1 Tax=Conexibacter stalactiti TaxID=1940611 RepID=A0ABU4HLU7_9ACTN|nr:rhodanese-like domain-containing protein [Conexibacter stalactiti]MDW5594273.1 rhodanese-like domain-containing protein [Conexibacter stalactiti]MEC5034915.1 rhodanese-like domain-containing protein [Conexibacter stalactiti]
MSTTATATVSAAEVRERLRGGGELALLDARELEDHRAGHPFWAAHLPPHALELALRLVPRRATPIVLTEVEPRVRESLARLLDEHGYHDVAELAGGNAGWSAAGGTLHRGLCAPSKALAERVEVPETTVDELAGVHSAAPLVLDVRSVEEYVAGTIPGAVACPGGELVRRAFALLAEQPARAVVVTCAGRTRARYGARTLIEAGLPAPVSALAGGTTAWQAAGHDLERHATRLAPPPAPGSDGERAATAGLTRLAARVAVPVAGAAELSRFAAEARAGERTLFLIDPRWPHDRPGAPDGPGAPHGRAELAGEDGVRAIPGGQLVEAVDEYVGTLGARIVLLDEPPFARALPLARWLAEHDRWELRLATPAAAQAATGGVAVAGGSVVGGGEVAGAARLAVAS